MQFLKRSKILYASAPMLALFLGAILVFKLGLPRLVNNSSFHENTKFGVWNRYLNQTNVVECINPSNLPVEANLIVLNSLGQALHARQVRFVPNGTEHIVLDSLTPISSYGTYAISVVEGEDSLKCHTVFYLPNNRRDTSSYSLPVLSSYSGDVYGFYNSFNPGSSNEPVANWLAISNPGNSPFSADIYVYGPTGALEDVIPLRNLPAFSRFDFALGHTFGQRVGMYKIKPLNASQPYSSYLVRVASKQGQVVSVYSLLPLAGSGPLSMLGTSTMGGSINWLEVGNTSGQSVMLRVRFFNQIGTVIRETDITLGSFAQNHIFVNEILGKEAIGKAEVVCLSPNCRYDSVIAQSLFYGFNGSELKWAYGSQALPFVRINNDVYSFPINTFLEGANWLKLGVGADSSISFPISAYRAGGVQINYSSQVQVRGSADLAMHELFGADGVGVASVVINGVAASSELIRVFKDAQGSISSINPIRSISAYENSFKLVRDLEREILRKGETPILHEPIYRREKDLYGYKPRFDPSHMGFNKDNHVLVFNKDGSINKLDSSGSWRSIDLKNQVRTQLLAKGIRWNEVFSVTSQNDHRIVFDREGDAYLIFDTTEGEMVNVQSNSKFRAGILVHSKDQGETWIPYILPTFTPKHFARLEFNDSNNGISGPPPILLHGGRYYAVNPKTNLLYCDNEPCPVPNPLFTRARLLLPKKKGDGTLDIGEEIKVAESTIFSAPHSGAGNSMVSVGDKIHIVYPSFNSTPSSNGTAFPCPTGTPQYVITYDRSLPEGSRMGTPNFLGCGGIYDRHPSNSPIPDGHNIPAITVDSRGYLHVLLGTHHDRFVYMKSERPNDSNSWSPGIRIGEPKRDPDNNYQPYRYAKTGSYTYISLICDRNDVLHVVARWTGLSYRSRLVYMRKSSLTDVNAGWSSFSDSYSQTFYPRLTNGILKPNDLYRHLHLVIPAHNGYVVYHHKLNIDKLGRLFLSYKTWEHQLSPEVADRYCSLWPSDCQNGKLTPDPGQDGCDRKVCWYTDNTEGKDPALLMSDDGGNSWKLATSQDFLDGMH